MSDTYEALIIGGGPAGLNAALILGRSCRKTLVLDDGRPRNAVVDRMHGFISRDGTPPLELLATARAELARYASVDVRQAHVESASGSLGAFEVRTRDGTIFRTKRLILATGVYDALPPIEGLREAWGRSAFVCPYCDGWEVRGKRIAVIGKGSKAVDLAQELWQLTNDIVVCTQGDDALSAEQDHWLQATGFRRITQTLHRIHSSDGRITSLEFEANIREACTAIFLSAPLRPRYPLVDMLGCKLRDDGEIAVDPRGRTSVAGVYAAGDAVTTVHQVALAAASGVCAAMGLNEDCIKEQVADVLASKPSRV